MELLVFGPAGSGKTTLVKNFGEWLKDELDLNVGFVNLDPGVKHLGYTPDFDIRTLFTVEAIMKSENLGPNGAIIKAMELIAKKSEEIKKEIEKINKELLLIDLPGQLEPFIFHSGSEIFRIFKKAIGIFLIPSELDVTGLAISQLFYLSTMLKLTIPCIMVLSKADIQKIERIDELLLNPEKLKEEILNLDVGMEKELVIGIADIISKMLSFSRIVKVSSIKRQGFDELYDLLHEVFCSCGEL